MGDELFLVAGHLLEAGLEGVDRGAGRGGRGGVGGGFAGGRDFALDVFEGIAAVDVKVGVAEGPALGERSEAREAGRARVRTCSPNWLSSEFLTWAG